MIGSDYLHGRTIVITGGSRGLGRAIATALSSAGGLVITTVRDAARLDEVRRELLDAGLAIEAYACDVTNEDSVAGFVDAVHERHPVVDAVVANAGVAGPIAPLHEIAPADWRACIDSNLASVFLTFRGFIPAMIAAGSGSLVAVSSITGKRPLAGRTPYAAAKMGIIGLVRSLAVELGSHGIRANSICPGSIDGPRLADVIARSARAQGVDEQVVRDAHAAGAALGRLVRPEEVAALCVLLAGDALSAITGQDINVSAGALMQ